jgi:transcriptional regulator with XRE-family HTH domain
MNWDMDKFVQWRAKVGLSQGEMGRLLGCGDQYVSRLERGVRNPSKGLTRFIAVLQWMPGRMLRTLIRETEKHRYDEEATMIIP